MSGVEHPVLVRSNPGEGARFVSMTAEEHERLWRLEQAGQRAYGGHGPSPCGLRGTVQQVTQALDFLRAGDLHPVTY